jgi:hypothetical protein
LQPFGTFAKDAKALITEAGNTEKAELFFPQGGRITLEPPTTKGALPGVRHLAWVGLDYPDLLALGMFMARLPRVEREDKKAKEPSKQRKPHL